MGVCSSTHADVQVLEASEGLGYGTRGARRYLRQQKQTKDHHHKQQRAAGTQVSRSNQGQGLGTRPWHKQVLEGLDYPQDLHKKYDKGKLLGKGSYGCTFLATALGGTEQYACKTLAKRELVNTSFEGSLREELQILYHLRGHPSVIKLHEALEDEEYIHFIMELCSGGDLVDNLVRAGKYSEADAAAAVRAVLRAVAYMHDMGVMHRDIKLENFLYDKDPWGPEAAHLKVIDFGLSTFFSLGQTFHERVGTCYYMAPEMLQDKGAYDQSVDMWAVGVLLYMLLSGHPPFEGVRDQDVFEHIRFTEPNLYDGPWQAISPAAKECVSLMMNRDPECRPSARAMLSHPWMAEGGAANDARLLEPEVLVRLRRFASASRLRQAAMKVLAGSCTPAEQVGLHQLFSSLDVDHSGALSLQELKAGLSKQVSVGATLRENPEGPGFVPEPHGTHHHHHHHRHRHHHGGQQQQQQHGPHHAQQPCHNHMAQQQHGLDRVQHHQQQQQHGPLQMLHHLHHHDLDATEDHKQQERLEQAKDGPRNHQQQQKQQQREEGSSDAAGQGSSSSGSSSSAGPTQGPQQEALDNPHQQHQHQQQRQQQQEGAMDISSLYEEGRPVYLERPDGGNPPNGATSLEGGHGGSGTSGSDDTSSSRDQHQPTLQQQQQQQAEAGFQGEGPHTPTTEHQAGAAAGAEQPPNAAIPLAAAAVAVAPEAGQQQHQEQLAIEQRGSWERMPGNSSGSSSLSPEEEEVEASLLSCSTCSCSSFESCLGLGPEALEQLLEGACLQGVGQISWEEFLAATMDPGRLEEEENIARVFKVFDLNHDGFLSVDEIRAAILSTLLAGPSRTRPCLECGEPLPLTDVLGEEEQQQQQQQQQEADVEGPFGHKDQQQQQQQQVSAADVNGCRGASAHGRFPPASVTAAAGGRGDTGGVSPFALVTGFFGRSRCRARGDSPTGTLGSGSPTGGSPRGIAGGSPTGGSPTGSSPRGFLGGSLRGRRGLVGSSPCLISRGSSSVHLKPCCSRSAAKLEAEVSAEVDSLMDQAETDESGRVSYSSFASLLRRTGSSNSSSGGVSAGNSLLLVTKRPGGQQQSQDQLQQQLQQQLQEEKGQ